MTTRSPALQRVCDAAVSHFSVNGYDGASLNEIAAMVGIKKASLYSHFTGKDALFLQVLDDAVAVESAFALETLAGSADKGRPGAAYVEAIADRYEASVHLRYLLRTVYLPPDALKGDIGKAYEGFLDLLRDGFLRQLGVETTQSLSETMRVRYGLAYVGIVESLFVELTYAGRDPMEARRAALWGIMTDSLALCGSQE